jgi:surface polysaccharide O-acyltransferase-like enzyme
MGVGHGPGQTSGGALAPAAPARRADADNLKVALVCGVIVAHVTMAWAALQGAWVFSEPPVREPLLSLLKLAAIVGTAFGMPLFFLVAGSFTPSSLRRKGLRRYTVDRTLRLLIPSLLFVILLTPPIEYVDPDARGWTRGYWAFVPHVWSLWPPAPGPTWFLGVLLVFSLGYGLVRSIRPSTTAHGQPLRLRHLVLTAAAVAVSSYLLRIVVPLGHEVWHLSLAQSPAWIAGFTVGVLGGERGWFQPVEPKIARIARWTAWAAIALCVTVVALVAPESGTDVLFGGGTWQSLVLAVLEATIMVTASLWLVDLFQRRFNHQGRLGREMSRAAFAAFLVHQLVLVGLVLASRHPPWPPELKYVAVAVAGVAISFALGSLLARLPGLSRIV